MSLRLRWLINQDNGGVSRVLDLINLLYRLKASVRFESLPFHKIGVDRKVVFWLESLENHDTTSFWWLGLRITASSPKSDQTTSSGITKSFLKKIKIKCILRFYIHIYYCIKVDTKFFDNLGFWKVQGVINSVWNWPNNGYPLEAHKVIQDEFVVNLRGRMVK